jgi:hypothetical protein
VRARFAVLLGSILQLTGCASDTASTPADPAALDPIARRYVILALALGAHDSSYVDAYYGPGELKTAAEREPLDAVGIRVAADSLIALLGDSVPAYQDSLVRLRHSYLRTQLGSMSARARMVAGEKLSFDQESEAIYAAVSPRDTDAHFDSLLSRLEALLPGPAPLADRYAGFRRRITVPADRLDSVVRAAIAACRARTFRYITLPAQERFELEFVKGMPWGAYHRYRGDYQSLIQVNTDQPITVPRTLDLACHEGYPGHHVYNASLEQALVAGRGWVEFSVYPLFSPQTLIGDGSANYGIELAFPGEQRTRFERDSLFPLAGLDPALADTGTAVVEIIRRLNHARNGVARRYLDGEIGREQAMAQLQRYMLLSPGAAASSIRFIEAYRSGVINYNIGRDLVAAWVERVGGPTEAGRWRAFAALLASPRLPPDLHE